MEPKMLEALENSIQYWQDIVDVKAVPLGSVSCPLCIYVKEISMERLDCTKCPVFTVSQEYVCKNTPYHIASEKLRAILAAVDAFTATADIIKDAPEELKEPYIAACRKELEFLTSLLPED